MTEKTVLVGHQTVQTDRPAGVNLAGADAHFGAKAITETVAESCRTIPEHIAGVHVAQKMPSGLLLGRNNGFGVTGTVAVDMLNGSSAESTNLIETWQSRYSVCQSETGSQLIAAQVRWTAIDLNTGIPQSLGNSGSSFSLRAEWIKMVSTALQTATYCVLLSMATVMAISGSRRGLYRDDKHHLHDPAPEFWYCP